MLDLVQLPRFLTPTLKMFLSVDLIGSTKLKHDENVLNNGTGKDASLENVGANWFNSLIDFYSGFEEKFNEAWSHAFSEDGIAETSWPKDANPSLWKINGDELIYILDITHPGEIFTALYAWREALLSYRQHLKLNKSRLDVKATAWMAGFPLGNHEVAFWSDLSSVKSNLPGHAGKFGQYYRLNKWYELQDSGGNSEFVKDYIGPAVDTGFRIARFSSSRRFPISIEIAYFLSKLSCQATTRKKMTIRFHGRESLKGVLSGIPYPIFWIDTACPDDELIKAEDKILPMPKPCDASEIEEYTKLFFDDEKNKLFRPFIFGYEDAKLARMPTTYEALLQNISEVWQAELQKYEIAKNTGEPDDGAEVRPITAEQIEAILKLLNNDS